MCGIRDEICLVRRGLAVYGGGHGMKKKRKKRDSPTEGSGSLDSQVRLVKNALNRQKHFLRAVVDSIPVGVFCKDVNDDFRIIIWNHKNSEITGIASEDAVGKTDYDLFSRKDADHFRADDKRVMETGEELEIPSEEVAGHPGGRLVLHTRKVPFQSPNGQFQFLLGICEDITSQVVAQERLDQANEELQQAQLQLIQMEKLESVGRLAAGVAHEVKNPLALILMGVEYLSEGIDPKDENVPVVVAEMREAVRRADKIVRGLVDFSSERQLDLKLVSANTLTDHTILMVRHELVKSGIKVIRETDTDLPLIKIDKTKFEQVLVNLFMNAIHAMQGKNEGALTIRIWKGVSGEQARNEGLRSDSKLREGVPVVFMEIEDTGGGIPQDKLANIFDPFYTTKPTGKGTGLGLTVVKKIVELHQGTVDVRNNDNGGATVRLTLKQSI